MGVYCISYYYIRAVRGLKVAENQCFHSKLENFPALLQKQRVLQQKTLRIQTIYSRHKATQTLKRVEKWYFLDEFIPLMLVLPLTKK